MVGLGAVAILAWLATSDLEAKLEVVFFDVGQGDSIFIQYQDQQVLIDGGPSGKVLLERLGSFMPFWDRKIELVILTHPDKDHLNGLIDVLERYEVVSIVDTGIRNNTKVFAKWEKAKKEEKAEEILAEVGLVFDLGSGASLVVLSADKEARNINDSSIVAKLIYGDASFLFTGDVGFRVEEELIGSQFDLSSKVLQAGHHGSKNSSSVNFLQEVNPEVIIISSGKNPYGHPREEALLRMKDFKVRRTDQEGNIKFEF